MKKAFVINTVLMGMVFLSGCGQQSVNQSPAVSSEKTPDKMTAAQETDTPPVDETESWLTYQDKELGLEMKYPQDNWVKLEDGPNGGIFCKGTRKIDVNTNSPYIDSQAGINIYTIENPQNLSIQELFDSKHEECLADMKNGKNEFGCAGAENVSEWKSIVIGGLPAFRSGMRPIPEGIPNDDVYIKLQNKYIVLSEFSGPYNDDKECQEVNSVFDKILSTLKFTK